MSNESLQQNLMNEVYEKWQSKECRSMDRLEVIGKFFTPKHKMAVQLGNMNYQVNNGGWSQWHFNGYSEDLEDLIIYAKKGVKLNIKHFDKLLNILTNIQNLGEPDDYNSTETHTCFNCDGEGYIYDYDENDEEIREECPECCGDGEYEEEINGEEVYCEELSNFDDEYYSINEEEILESFNILLEQYGQLENININEITATEIKKPKCKLMGEDGNVFNIIGKVQRTLKGAGLSEQAEEFKNKAMSSHSYDAVLCLCMDYVNIY